jgi:hypothetical protein
MEGHFSQRLSMNGQIVWYKCNNFLQIDVTGFYGFNLMKSLEEGQSSISLDIIFRRPNEKDIFLNGYRWMDKLCGTNVTTSYRLM